MINVVVNEIKQLAVVGMDEYKGKIECVDGWISNADEKLNDYIFYIERVETGLYLYTNKLEGRETGFITTCDSTNEQNALQALSYLVSKRHVIGFDWYDVAHIISINTDYYTGKFAYKSCVSDTIKWMKKLGTKKDLHNDCLLLVCGSIGLLEINDISNAFEEIVGKGVNIIVALVDTESKNDSVQISLWFNKKMVNKYLNMIQ